MEVSANIPARGYPRDMFLEGCDDKYVCAICTEALDTACQGLCGHRFCRGCVQQLMRFGNKEKKTTCPGCLSEDKEKISHPEDLATLSEIYPDNATNRELNRKPVRCLTSGCKWKGLLKEYKIHRDQCRLNTRQCVLCGKVVHIGEELRHDIIECQKRRVSCVRCKAPVTAGDIKMHLRECQGNKTNEELTGTHAQWFVGTFCPFGCDAVVSTTDEYVSHCTSSLLQHMSSIRAMVLQTRQLGMDRLLDSGFESFKSGRNHSDEAINSANLEHIERKTRSVESKMSHMENTCGVLVREIEKQSTKNQSMERQRVLDRELLDDVDRKLKALERTVALKKITIADMELRLQTVEHTSYDGTLTWKITNFSRKRQEAVSGRINSIYSPVFYSSTKGYKMCARLYLNGDGIGKGTHVSVFFVLMRGNFDALLQWPFRQKVTFKLLDQNKREDVVDTFRPDPTSSSFRRPTSEMNIASGCPMFMPLELLSSPHYAYVKDDVVFLEVCIEE